MDSVRHNANSIVKYGLYFDLLQHKVAKYDIQPSEMYNIDKKGFAIRVISRSRRIFSREAYERRRVSSALQDSSCEWVTVLASICANRSSLPPSIIYATAQRDIQAS
jgi:hypothetical protein